MIDCWWQFWNSGLWPAGIGASIVFEMSENQRLFHHRLSVVNWWLSLEITDTEDGGVCRIQVRSFSLCVLHRVRWRTSSGCGRQQSTESTEAHKFIDLTPSDHSASLNVSASEKGGEDYLEACEVYQLPRIYFPTGVTGVTTGVKRILVSWREYTWLRFELCATGGIRKDRITKKWSLSR